MPYPPRFMLAFVALALLSLAVFSAISFASKPPVPYPMPPLGPTLGEPSPHARASRVAVTFVDADPGWDWDNTCQEEVAAWLAGRGLAVEAMLLTLEPDDHTLPVGVAYPSVDDPEALVLAGCDVAEAGLTCRLAVAASASSAALDAAASVALVAALADHLRPKDQESWANREAWDWAEYQPLLQPQEEGAGWRSTCLRMQSR
jgi:hypothetical protein